MVNREGLYVLTINLRSIAQITAVSISDGEVLLYFKVKKKKPRRYKQKIVIFLCAEKIMIIPGRVCFTFSTQCPKK